MTVGMQEVRFGLSKMRHGYPRGETFDGFRKTNKVMMGRIRLQGMNR